jgi:hypothetical protein
MSAGIFDYSVSGASAWFDIDVFTSNDPGQAAGWYDIEYLQPPIAQGPQVLYYLQGGGDPWIFDPVTETFHDPSGLYKLAVPWQVIDELGDKWKPGSPVTWDKFQNRIVLERKREEGNKEFHRLAKELLYQQDYGRIVRKTIKVAGITYIVWKVIQWL